MCLFCDIAEGNIPSKKIYEDELVYAFLDISQAEKGHTLVIPKKHYANILEVDDETLQHMIKVVRDLAKQIMEKMGAEGCNVLSNTNEVAGQSIMHFHFHIIPRYADDDLVIGFTSHEYDLDEIQHQICD